MRQSNQSQMRNHARREANGARSKKKSTFKRQEESTIIYFTASLSINLPRSFHSADYPPDSIQPFPPPLPSRGAKMLETKERDEDGEAFVDILLLRVEALGERGDD